MITISDNDLKQLLLCVQAASGSLLNDGRNIRLYNRIRLGKITLRKLMKRPEVRRLMSNGAGALVADK